MKDPLRGREGVAKMDFLEIFKACLGIKGEGGLSNIMIQENTSFMAGSLCIIP